MKFHLPHKIEDVAEQLGSKTDGGHFVTNNAIWSRCKKPYYKCYEPFLKAIERLNLDRLDADMLALPDSVPQCGKHGATLRAICVRFPEGGEPSVAMEETLKLQSLIIGIQIIPDKTPEICVTGYGADKDLLCFQRVLKPDRKKLLDVFSTKLSCKAGVTFLAKLVGAIGLLSTGADGFISRDVLANDQLKYDQAGDDELRRRLEQRAERRGVLGWSLGKNLESVPHFRRPHLAIRWTGKGKTIPKLVTVKGAVVKPQRMKKIPTGFINSQGVEEESINE